MDDYIKSLLKDFFEEAFEMLDRLEENILILDKDRDNVDAVQEIFRAVHTLKGSAGAVELLDTQKYAHRFEDLLDLIRDKKINVDDAAIDILLKGIDILKELINSASNESVCSINIDEEIKKLDDFKNSKLGSETKTEDSNSDEVIDNKTSNKYDNLNLDNSILSTIREHKDDGLKIKLVYVKFNAESPMRTVGGVQVFVALKDKGDIVTSVPPLQNLEGDEFYQDVIYLLATLEEDDDIINDITFPETTEEIKIEEFILEDYEKTAASKKSKEVSSAVKDEKNVNKDKKVDRQSSYLRVESDRIDAMMNQVGELVTNKSSYVQYDDDLSSYGKLISNSINDIKKYYRDTIVQLLRKFEDYAQKKEIKDLRSNYINSFNSKLNEISKIEDDFKYTLDKYRSSYQLLTRVTNELQETVMKIRMVPIAQTFNRFPRLIRDLSRDLGKEIRLEMHGEDTELDKSVIETLVDPLVHIASFS